MVSSQPNVDQRPIARPEIISQMMQGEAVLVLPHQAEVKVLNQVGARIWSLVDGTRTIRAIATIICSEFEVDQTEAEADTLAFIGELAQRKIVEVR